MKSPAQLQREIDEALERSQQLRGVYTKMVNLQLAAPGTPEEYKLGYREGVKLRKRG